MQKNIFKRILILLIIFTIIANIMPNFGLLKISRATDSKSGIIIKPGVEEFETVGDKTIFKLNVYLSNVTTGAWYLGIHYNPENMIPAYIDGSSAEEALTGSEAVAFSDKRKLFAEGDLESQLDNDTGYILFSGLQPQGNPVEIGDELKLVCEINFMIVNSSLRISDISEDDFTINADDSQINIDDEECYAVDFPEYFSIEGFSSVTTPVVTSISITTDPKKEYIVGESLDLSSMEVTAIYDNDPTNTKVLSSSEYTTNADTLDLTTAGTKTLTVTYLGTDIAEGATAPTASVDIKVRAKQVTSIEIQGLDSSYKQGTEIDLSKISVIATYENDSTDTRLLNSNEYDLSATGNSIVNGKIKLDNAVATTITATYKGTDIAEGSAKPTATHTITITEKVLERIEVTAPAKDVYTVGEKLDLSGMTVTAIYDNGETPTVTDYTTSIANGAELSGIGVQTITVTYNGKSATVDILVFPTKLVGTEGNNLSTVVAPEGFEWVNGDTTVLSVGESEYTLKYINTTPEMQKTCNIKVLGVPSNLTATYGDTLADVQYNGTALPTGFAWTNTAESVGNAGDQTHNITYAGYTGLTATVKVAKKTLTKDDVIPNTTLPASKIYDGAEAQKITVTLPNGAGTPAIKYYKSNGEEATEVKNVDIYTVKVSVAEGTNYTELAEVSLGTYTIGKAMLTKDNFNISGMPNNNTKEYDGQKVIVNATIKDGIIGAGNTVIVKYYKDGEIVGTTIAPSDYGTYEVKANVNEGDNYWAADGTPGKEEISLGTFTITETTLKEADITYIEPADLVYDGNKKEATVEIPEKAGDVTITYWQGGTKVEEPINVGTYTVKITTTGGDNFAAVTEPMVVGTFTITPREVTVTIEDKTSVYGEELKELTSDVTVGTVVNGDDLGITLTKAQGTDAREYTITGTATNTNYDVKFVDGTYTITAKEITVTIQNATSKYKEALAELACTTNDDLVGTDSLETIVELSTDATETSNVGEYDITGKTINNNYVVTFENEDGTSNKGIYEITKSTLKLENFDVTGIPENNQKKYDGQPLSISATVKTGIIGAGNAVTVKYYKDGAEATNTTGYGTYVVKININEGTNYFAADGTDAKPEIEIGTVTITPKDFDASKITYTDTAEYDGTEKTDDISITDDTITGKIVKYYQVIDGVKTEVTPKNAGTYTIEADITTQSSGHIGVVSIGTFTITQKPITVEIQNETIVYGEELTAIRTNDDVDICTGDNIDDIITYELSAKTVGTQTIIGKVKDTETAKNYNVTFVNGTCTITPKAITITIGNTSSEYTGTEPTMPATSTLITIPDGAIVGTDDLGITLTKASGVDAGDYAITGAYTNTNYNITFVNKEDNTKATGTYTITRATLTSEDFNNDLPTEDVTFGTTVTINPTYKAGITTADAGAITVKYYKKDDNTEVPNPTAVGTYVVKVSTPGGTNYYPADGSTDAEGNTYAEIKLGEFSIVRSTELPTITITAPTDNIYDKTKKEPTINKPDGIGNATITYYKKEDGSAVTEPIDAGTYIVKVATDGGENYGPMPETKVGEFTILPRPVEVTIEDKTSVYGNTIETLTSNVTNGTIMAGDDLGITLTKADGTDVDTYAITGTATNTNYDVTFVDGEYTITARPITVTIEDKTSIYGKALETLTCSVAESLATGDTLEQIIKLTTTATTTSNVGTYDITGTVINNNYTVTYTNANDKGTYTITKADPECNIAELPATYGDTLANITLPTRADGTYTWNDATTTSVGNAGRHTFKVTFTPNDTINYNTLTNIDVTVNVAKAIPTYTIPTGLEGYEGQPISSIDITAHTGFSWTNGNTILPLIKDNGETFNTTMTYTPVDTENFEIVENIPVEVKIKENEIIALRVKSAKADGSNPEYFEGQSFDRDDILVEAEWAIGGWQEVTDYELSDKDGNTLNRVLTKDDTKVIVSYAGLTTEQPITVREDYVTDITITAPSKLDYNYGDAINLANATITKVWASGLTHTNDTIPMTLDMLSNADITSFDNMETLGTKQITVTFDTVVKTNAFQIEVSDYIDSISIVDKTILEKDYNYGDTIDVTGGKINVNYKSGRTETEDITTDMVSGFNMNKVEDGQIVTVTYEGKTDTFEINVKDKVIGIEITKEPAKKVYKLNEAVNFSDIEVKNIMASGAKGAKLTASEYTIGTVDTTTVGEKTVTVTKNGTTYADNFKIKVIDATEGMNITKLPKTSYKYGEGLDITSGEITITSQTETKVLPMTDASVKVTGYNPNKLGDQTITVTYTYTEETDNGIETKQKTDTYTVTVKDYAIGIAITKNPDKLTYEYGEELELAGGKVAEKMASGATRNEVAITGEMISGYNKEIEGAQVVTVTYLGQTATFNVRVEDLTKGISMKTLPNKTEYTQGETIDVTGAVLNVTKSSGIKEVAVTKEMISGYDPNKVGTQVITVTYDGKQTEFVINVKEAPKKPTTPTKPSTPDVKKYTVTFINYDGEVIKTEEVEAGKPATAPEVEARPGYKFMGWNRDFDTVEEDLIVMAKYESVLRAKVNAPDNIEVEQGGDIDLSEVTLVIFDEDGNEIDEIPVTKDMISGFDSNKIGAQIITVTYVDEDGFEYTATFKIKVVKPTEVLGVKDEVTTEENNLNGIIIPSAVGIGAIGLLLLLIGLATRKNVQIYALTEDERKLIGKEKITNKNRRIDLDGYEKKLENANIEIVLNKKITRKLDEEMVDIIFKGKKSTYKVKDMYNKEFTIKMKNV